MKINYDKAIKIVDQHSEIILEEIRKKLSRLIKEYKGRLKIKVENYPRSTHTVQYSFNPSYEIEIQIFKTETITTRWFRSDWTTITYGLRVYETDGSRYSLLAKSSYPRECRQWFNELERKFNSDKEVERAQDLLKQAERLNKKISKVKAL